MEKLYPYMHDALEDKINEEFRRACERNGLEIDAGNFTQLQTPDAAFVDFYQEIYPARNNVKSWLDECRQQVGSQAILLYPKETPGKLAACCLLEPATAELIHGEAEEFVCSAQEKLGIPLANRMYCNSIAVASQFRGLGIAPGLTWIARNIVRQPQGLIYLSRILEDNHPSMRAAGKTGQASTGIYNHVSRKYLWWGIIPPST
ncbi:MAG TPA: hypothetical protein VLG11_00880 [Candidatus Saccharimonadales bacterium]|nr:hypothetical protein [Candidatus Saccharimonadales bacterium]